MAYEVLSFRGGQQNLKQRSVSMIVVGFPLATGKKGEWGVPRGWDTLKGIGSSPVECVHF